MSIHDWINSAAGDAPPRLHWVDPVFTSDPVVRRVLVTPEIWNLIDSPPSRYQARCDRLRADIESFVTGDEIAVSLTPFQAGGAYMGLLAPPQDGVFEFRSRDHSPGLRLLGHFADRDLFVVTVIASRSVPWPPVMMGPLGSQNSPEWAAAINAANAAWRRLFGPFKQAYGGDIRDVLSGKYHLV
jgi:hypothetical protein